MVTRRGFWMIFTSLFLVVVALVHRNGFLGLLGGTCLVWALWELGVFLLRAKWAARQLTVERFFNGQPAGRQALWAGKRIAMTLRVSCKTPLGLNVVAITDSPPTMGHMTDPEPFIGPCLPGMPLEQHTEYRSLGSGRTRFEGFTVELADPQGMFYHRFFLHQPLEVLMLPQLMIAKGEMTTVKRHNQLLQHGQHRHRQTGSGMELLDLRDYLPGDPPKTIAWKISARRDRLVTKEYESEVPIRCQVFVDVSPSVRIGPAGRTAWDHLVQVASGFGRQLLDLNDPLGLWLFDHESTKIVEPRGGMRHWVRINRELAEAGSKPIPPVPCPPERLIYPLAQLCRRSYRPLLNKSINRPGPWYYFLPLVGRPIFSMSWYALAFLLIFVALAGGALLALQINPESVRQYLPTAIGLWCNGFYRFQVWDILVLDSL